MEAEMGLVIKSWMECYIKWRQSDENIIQVQCIIFMSRKYSEVVNYIPDFPRHQFRNINREANNNQKLSPVEPYRPNLSPTVYENGQYRQFLGPAQVPTEGAVTANSSFQFSERRSLPVFNGQANGMQTVHSPLIDPRNQHNNGFRVSGIMNHGVYTRRAANQNFSSEPIQQFNSPQNFIRTNPIDLAQLHEGIRRNIMTAHTSPSKIDLVQRNNNEAQKVSLNIPRDPEIRNLNISHPRDNGRFCQSVIIPELKIPSRNLQQKAEIPGLAPSLLHQNSSTNSADLQSTISSDTNTNSWVDLNSPLLSDQGTTRTRKFQGIPNYRKRDEIWKSAEIGMLKNNNAQSLSQLGQVTSNQSLNSIDLGKEKEKEDSFTRDKKKNIEPYRFEEKEAKLQLSDTKRDPEQVNRSIQSKFRKKMDYNATNTVLDLTQINRFKELREPPSRKVFTMDDFQVIEKLGRGAYGDVFMVREKVTRFTCVIKSLSKKKIKQLKIQQLVFRQIKIQSYLVHKHITTLYGVFDDQSKIYLIMQCMPDGNLASNGKKKISENETAHLVHQVCQGLQYMHREDIIHRDIKPQNLLLNNTYLKIGDFGCAVFGNALRRTIVGCYAYISPEQFSNTPYDQKIDSWSVGILAYELLTGKPPYQQKLRKMAQSQIIEPKAQQITEPPKIQFSQLSFPKELKLSAEAIDFIRRLLDPDPATRADVKQALRHKFLQKSKQYQKYLESQL